MYLVIFYPEGHFYSSLYIVTVASTTLLGTLSFHLNLDSSSLLLPAVVHVMDCKWLVEISWSTPTLYEAHSIVHSVQCHTILVVWVLRCVKEMFCILSIKQYNSVRKMVETCKAVKMLGKEITVSKFIKFHFGSWTRCSPTPDFWTGVKMVVVS